MASPFSFFYFRADTFLKQNTGDASGLQEAQNLTMFLATQDQITSKLKSKLEVVPGYEDLLCEIVDLCCNFYEQKAYVLPAEKHMLLKVRAAIFQATIKHRLKLYLGFIFFGLM